MFLPVHDLAEIVEVSDFVVDLVVGIRLAVVAKEQVANMLGIHGDIRCRQQVLQQLRQVDFQRVGAHLFDQVEEKRPGKEKKRKIAETALNQAPKMKISSPDYQIFIDIPEIDKKFH